jgi:hypothetical protein
VRISLAFSHSISIFVELNSRLVLGLCFYYSLTLFALDKEWTGEVSTLNLITIKTFALKLVVAEVITHNKV